MEQLGGQDASFLYFETPATHMHIGSVALYDQSSAPGGQVRFRDLVDNVRKRLHLAKCFRRRVVEVPLQLDHPYWLEDRHFDLEFHVRHIALPPPGDWRQLCRQAARLHSYPLDRSHPLWEMTVISGLKDVGGVPEGAFAVLLKVHHAAIDGASGAALTEVIHDESPKVPRVPLPDQIWVGQPEPSAPELMARTFGNNVLQPFRFAEVLSRTVPAMQRVSASLRNAELVGHAAGRMNVPRTRFNAPVTAHRVVDGRSYPLDAMRRIKRAVDGATINDAVLAVIGGALRRYLQAHDELPDRSLSAMAPINVRSADESAAEGNRVAAMTASLGTEIDDPLERLAAVSDGTRQSKALTDAIGARLMTDYSRFIPAQLASLAARLYTSYGMAERALPAFNCVVTNVPGPQKPLYMSGAKLLRTYGLGPLFDGMGLIFPVFSYDGGITLSFTSCREMLPDPERLAEALDESFHALESATA
ncbi:MAG: wax ester/triacylglycerol synthase family O-acyltransferase [Gammaproteobacteria bacterium]|nr:wax ester/triacylglycerol synthase family O-acyltransferase [Gammaproteobacteria bacterium]MYE52002.1 wax ester/triacylglycerol synthase family O-acyltransferase [Gammaproteobacteria bacterium]MYF50672.1 wax ester/triacylglycerol synthase family O-acyltransferase [Gammaproteobacteria bacterium]MYH14820.1 wax ester/triacylglycerol synthase family O-acyltransferase [Gammaproteobacteria bacterium]MYK82234.1 wax ester/triacylglycerol synthase family O-acyltransferase [Gammaproteobacteria bacteri